jgi:peptide/nickel transport system ATP-binding protein/oligopeptide transport system ATP-binding protein
LRHKIGEVKAVDDVSFTVGRGQTVGLVGESGSGKTTIGRTIIRLTEPTAGTITFEDAVISKLTSSAFRPFRKKIQIIFQDPYNSLNPRLSIFEIIGEALEIHFPQMSRADRRARVAELLEKVGLKCDHLDRYPHEFSGGQRQRVGIARALGADPPLLLFDEPFASLDPITRFELQRQFVELRRTVRKTALFVTHDVREALMLATRIALLRDGALELVATPPEFRNAGTPEARAFLAGIEEDGRPK